jgi:hypothetical protein
MIRKVKFTLPWRDNLPGDVVEIREDHDFADIINRGAGHTVADDVKLVRVPRVGDAKLQGRIKELETQNAALRKENAELKEKR